MMDIKQYDHIVLKDGREGAVIEIYGDGEEFDVDVGDSPKTWGTVYGIKREDIIAVGYKGQKAANE